MNKPELVFVVGCNAAGKSSFIRSPWHLTESSPLQIAAKRFKHSIREFEMLAIMTLYQNCFVKTDQGLY